MHLRSLVMIAVVLAVMGTSPAYAASAASRVVLKPVATITGERILAELVANVDAVELTSHSAVVHVRPDKTSPTKPIRIEFGQAVSELGSAEEGQASASPLLQVLLLLGLARYVLRFLGRRQAESRVRVVPEDRTNVKGH